MGAAVGVGSGVGVGPLVAAGSETSSLLESFVLSDGAELLDAFSPEQAVKEHSNSRTSNRAVIFFICGHSLLISFRISCSRSHPVTAACFPQRPFPFFLRGADAVRPDCKYSIAGETQFVKCLFRKQYMLEKHNWRSGDFLPICGGPDQADPQSSIKQFVFYALDHDFYLAREKVISSRLVRLSKTDKSEVTLPIGMTSTESAGLSVCA